ncbi:MAG: hypothetical protein UZ09_BCD002000451 [Bacteroidetes bacterium OLB9]|nr:MAG: hypothetical protein UZ09_BCD002000451 [Bacteroidetes bacterium OLB9]
MYSEKIERLLELALADGAITNKEKQVLLKEAEAEGIDLNEFEVVLEGRLHELTKLKKSTKSDKFGEVRKCPSCGAPVESFSATCSNCDYDFRNIDANSSIQLLSNKLEEVITECTNTIRSATDREKEILVRQREIIKNFPIPNTKEDILELLYFIQPKTQSGLSTDKNYSAWKGKFTEVLNRAKVLFEKDPKMMQQITTIESQHNTKGLLHLISKIKEINSTVLGIIIVAIILIIGYFATSYIGNKGIEKESQRLELILKDVKVLIQEKKYDEAEVLNNQLYWEYSGLGSSTKNKENWDAKREYNKKIIRDLKWEEMMEE